MLLPNTFPLYANAQSLQTGSFVDTVHSLCIRIHLLSTFISFYWNQAQVLKGVSGDDFNPQKSIRVFQRGIRSTVTLILLLRASSTIDLGWNSTGRMYGSLIANGPIVMFLLSPFSCRSCKLAFRHPRRRV